MPRTTIAGKINITIDSGADISVVRSDLVNDYQYLPGTVKVTEGEVDCKLAKVWVHVGSLSFNNYRSSGKQVERHCDFGEIFRHGAVSGIVCPGS